MILATPGVEIKPVSNVRAIIGWFRQGCGRSHRRQKTFKCLHFRDWALDLSPLLPMRRSVIFQSRHAADSVPNNLTDLVAIHVELISAAARRLIFGALDLPKSKNTARISILMISSKSQSRITIATGLCCKKSIISFYLCRGLLSRRF
jgi:hypothetical protein